jgi:DNA (cytosine-5)-methyltransferase 1
VYNIIDLFAGCGGFSTGFEQAGFKVKLALEKDVSASETYKYNHPNTQIIVDDITKIKSIIKHIDYTVDGVIGGPPCQSFSLSGQRDPKDPRGSLFMDFMRIVREVKSSFFVMENVPGMLSMKTSDNKKVIDIVLNEMENSGYNVVHCVLNAAEFGVPQNRQRLFFIGIRKDIPFEPEQLIPKGFLFGKDQITIEQAIMDLPQIKASEGIEQQEYISVAQNTFQEYCRKDAEFIYNHIAMKHTNRLIERFNHIRFGQSVADVPDEFGQRKRGEPNKISGKKYSQNNYRPFPNKPSPTIPASFQSNFVHPYINRNYTAREGARLQAFPDTYIFKGNRTNMSWDKNLSQYQQIGNAVPPLLAKHIALTIKKYFDKLQKKTTHC